MTRSVNADLISLARESRGLIQTRLADRMGISQSKLSKYENGTLAVSSADLGLLSEATRYTEDFFLLNADVWGLGTLCVYYRKRASVSVSISKVIQAKLNILRFQLRNLIKGIRIDVTRPLPRLDVDEFGGPEAVAREIRRVWKLPAGPLKNLSATVENAGAMIQPVEFGTNKIDAVSQNIDEYPPVFMVNKYSPGDRLRFSIAHELGHVIMHAAPSANMEDEANRFASELLMPADEIGPSLRNLSLDKAANLKSVWRMSMQALIKRAADLNRITERQSRTLFMQMGKHGWRLKEPVHVDREQPTVIQGVLHVHAAEHDYSLSQFARAAFLCDQSEFTAIFGFEPEHKGLRVI